MVRLIPLFPLLFATLIFVNCGPSASTNDLNRHIRYNRVYQVRSALSSGTSVNHSDSSGNTLLHHACYYRASTDVARLLIQRGANINARNRLGYTPLHTCALNGCANTIRVLLRAGANKRARDKAGLTPYDRAKWVQQRHVLGLLKP
ncbi:ankyrin repeat domain-containing protein [Myxococcota bacterium]|nr:ankyrin repeat domain-containing protein [Myxococcota bacterium]MBU1536666.1 ankyrin repeat domain-containing protein [Myxococcota bacterium]